MKKYAEYLSVAVFLTAGLVACTIQKDAPVPNPRPEIVVTQDTVLTAVSFEARLAETISSAWTSDAMVYDNVKKHEGRLLTPSSADGLKAVLEGEVYMPTDMFFAVYPAAGFGDLDAGKIQRTIPQQQTASPLSEGSVLAPVPQVAFTSSLGNSLIFKPVAAYACVTVMAQDVKSFTLAGLADEDICGGSLIDIYSVDVQISEGLKTLTVTAEEGKNLTPGQYCFEIASGDYSGFKAVLTFADGSSFENVLEGNFTSVCGEAIEIGKLTDNNIYAPEVKLGAVAFKDAKLSWEAVETAEGYKVYVNGNLVATLDKAVTEYTVGNLNSGASNDVKVEAFNDRQSAGTTLAVQTKGLRQCTLNTGTTFLCIDWDPVCRTRNDGYEQAYQVQIFEDASCTSPVYDFVPYDGQKQVNPTFGNSSYFGQTKQPQDGIKCDNYLTPTRVSVGGLYPATTYYVRVRTLESVTVQSRTSQSGSITEKTLTNAFGTSQWSDVVALTTDSEKVLDSKAVLYCGFNDCCVQSDYKAWSPGAVPYGFLAGKPLSDCWLPWNHANRDKTIGFAFYAHGTRPQHQLNTWNLAKDGVYVNGLAKDAAKGQNYLIGRDKGSVNAITGDIAGWHFHQWCRPFMGMLGLDGDGVSVATPAIAPGQVAESGSDCTISFSAIARVRPQDNYNGTLEVRVYRAATKVFETIAVITADKLIPYAAGAVSGNYICDFTGHVHTFTANLKPGDAVELYNTKNELILVDDILITKGVNIDNVDRDPIEW